MPTVLVVILFAYFYVCTTLASEYTLARVRARSIHNIIIYRYILVCIRARTPVVHIV